jgi:hypothetical protein
MKTYGLKEKQELISIPLDDDNNPRLDTLKPPNAGDDWIPPEVIPLVKLLQPTLNPLKEYCKPKLVWFSDRVERDWEIKTIPPIPPEQIAEEAARKAAKLALIEKQKKLYAPYIVRPEDFSLATSVEDQNAFTRLLTLLNTANVPDSFETTISDVSNKLHTLTFGRFKEIMLSYGLEIHTRWIQFKS